MFTFETTVASHHMIRKPKRYNYRNPPGLFFFMYSPPHAQRTPKISSIKNCALLLLYSFIDTFPKIYFRSIFGKWSVCVIYRQCVLCGLWRSVKRRERERLICRLSFVTGLSKTKHPSAIHLCTQTHMLKWSCHYLGPIIVLKHLL